MASERVRQLRDRYRNMKSGGGVLCISFLQLIVGLVLLGIYEGYKVLALPLQLDLILHKAFIVDCFVDTILQ